MARQGLGKDAPHREHDKSRYQHQFVGYRIKDSAELRTLIEAPREQTVETVGDACEYESCQGQQEPLIKKQCDEDRYQNHPEDG